MAKKEEIARRLEGDLSSLQETVKSYSEEVWQSSFNSRGEASILGCVLFSERNLNCFFLIPGRSVEWQAHGHADNAYNTWPGT